MRRVEGADEALADGVEIGKAKVAARDRTPPGLAEALDQDAPVVGDPLRVRNMVSGQPPCSPRRCSALM